MIYRQGDVLIRKVPSLPKGSTAVVNADRVVLAHGEVTGHAHAIAPGLATEFTMLDAERVTRRFLEITSDKAAVTHEEHATIPLPPGFYEITIQREYDPVEVRQVAD
jgi:hypothetical protein